VESSLPFAVYLSVRSGTSWKTVVLVGLGVLLSSGVFPSFSGVTFYNPPPGSLPGLLVAPFYAVRMFFFCGID